MTTEKMSLTEALVQIKHLEIRIKKAIRASTFVAVRIGQDEPDRKCTAESDIDKISGLIKRRNAIQRAKLIANSKTEITIGGVSLTISEAIERKKSIEFDQYYLAELRTQLDQVQNDVKYTNQTVQERLDKQMEETYGKAGKVREEDYRSISEPFLKNNKAVIVDPANISELIQVMDEDIDKFTFEIDMRLSEINARTEIEVTY